jgi:hypothetical protein
VTCWKNYAPEYLATSSNGVQVNALAVSGGDVYAAGNTSGFGNNGIAHYWKNGQQMPLSGFVDNGYAGAIAINGQDVYIAGGTDNSTGSDRALYWKNGVPVLLSNGTDSMGLYANEIAIEAASYK